MRKTLALVLCLLAFPASAQTGPEVYKMVSNAQIQPFSTTGVETITQALYYRMTRLICTVSCYIAVNASGATNTVTNVTGHYLPADTPVLFSIGRNSKISVLSGGSAGSLHVIELSR